MFSRTWTSKSTEGYSQKIERLKSEIQGADAILIGAGSGLSASAGLTYGKTLGQAVEIGTRLAASVITSSENVCPRFRPEEFGIEA